MKLQLTDIAHPHMAVLGIIKMQLLQKIQTQARYMVPSTFSLCSIKKTVHRTFQAAANLKFTPEQCQNKIKSSICPVTL